MHSPIERIAFRPETPSVRLAVAKHTDLHLVRGDVPQLSAAGTTVAHVHDAHDSSTREGGRRDEIVPLPRDGSEGARPTPREGLLGLLHLLDARSDVIRRLADAFEASFGALMRVRALGITLRDPRARWASGPGRDPSILELAVNRDGDSIGTYYYPPARMSRVPVVLVSKATGEARWLADDFDVWFAGVLFNAQAYSPQTVEELLDELSLPREFPQPLANATPPPWFFEAHATSWSIQSADRAMADGDLEGAERMLVSIARTNPDTAETRLIEIYTQLAWDHHRAAVVETW